MKNDKAARARIGRRLRSSGWLAVGEEREYGQEDKAGSPASDDSPAGKWVPAKDDNTAYVP